MTRTPTRLTRLVAVLALGAGLTAGCSTAPPVGPEPGSSAAAASPSPSASSPTPADALSIEIQLDQKTVTPLDKTIDVRRGRTVVLITRSDHDATLTVDGGGVDRSVFIGRLTTISTTFVVDQTGVVTISSVDPAATVARLVVS